MKLIIKADNNLVYDIRKARALLKLSQTLSSVKLLIPINLSTYLLMFVFSWFVNNQTHKNFKSITECYWCQYLELLTQSSDLVVSLNCLVPVVTRKYVL